MNFVRPVHEYNDGQFVQFLCCSRCVSLCSSHCHGVGKESTWSTFLLVINSCDAVAR